MKSLKLTFIAFLFCTLLPALSFADPLEDAQEAYQSKNYKKVVEILTPLADQGNAKAKALLGNMYYSGDGIEKDEAKGFQLLTEAGDMGVVPALTALASIAIGNKEYDKAIKILEPMAAEDVLDAKKVLGVMYCRGYGVEQDIGKGLSMIMDAAEKGDEAAKQIATSMNRGFADLGDARAMYNMGYMCIKKWGGDQDPEMCLLWLEKAAEKGHAKSARILSSIYSKGKYGIEADQEKAAKWSSLAGK